MEEPAEVLQLEQLRLMGDVHYASAVRATSVIITINILISIILIKIIIGKINANLGQEPTYSRCPSEVPTT